MAHYVITGASGHIGNNLVKFINNRQADATVTVLTRRLIKRELETAVCTQVIGDIGNADFLDKNIGRGDVVIHCAGLIDLSDKRKAESYTVNYLYTKTICDICRKKRVGKFIYIGSVDAIYKEKDEMIVEPAGYYPDRIEGQYGKTKAMATQYVIDSVQSDKDFHAAVVLPSAVIGIHDYKPSAVGKVICDTLQKKPQFGINGGYNFVNVLDVCKGIYALCNNHLTGQYILSGYHVSVKELYGYINRLKGLDKRPIILPAAIVKLFLPFIKVLNKITLKSLREPHLYSCEKAKKELGYEPMPVEQTIMQTVEWFEENIINSH